MSENAESLHQELRRIVAADRENLVLFLRCLDAFDRERGWARMGRESLWAYLVRELHLPEASAWRRQNALHLLRRHPGLEAPLSDGRLNLTTLGVLGPALTAETLDDLVAQAAYLSKREAEELVVKLQPRHAPDTGLRKLPDPRPGLALAFAAVPASAAALAPPSAAVPVWTSAAEVLTSGRTPAPAPREPIRPPAPPPRVEPVAEERWSLRITLDRKRKDGLDELRRLLAHKVPAGNLEALFDVMLEDALELERKKRGLARPSRKVKPRPPRPPTPGERAPVPGPVRREVLERDGYRCTYAAAGGRRCEATERLEMHHLTPAPITGTSTARELTTHCKAHNALAADDWYGRELVERRIAEARRRRGSLTPQIRFSTSLG